MLMSGQSHEYCGVFVHENTIECSCDEIRHVQAVSKLIDLLMAARLAKR